MESTDLSVLVIGCGAVGSFYGGKLQQAGARVAAVIRTGYDRVVEHGIRVESVLGDFVFRPDGVFRSTAEFAGSAAPPDVVLVALKVLPDIDLPALLRPVVGEQTAVFLLQNGIDIEPPVQQAFPGRVVISGLAFTCINRIGPAHVQHIDYGRVTLGVYPRGRSPVADRLAAMFAQSGVPVQVSDNIVRDRWGKLLWNAPFNPVSVLGGGVTTRQIMDSPEALKLARAVMEEVRSIAAARGVDLPGDWIQRNLDATDKMKPYKTSMCLDYENGRPLEVEAILGNAVRAARSASPPVAVPHIESLYALLQLVDDQIRLRAGLPPRPSSSRFSSVQSDGSG